MALRGPRDPRRQGDPRDKRDTREGDDPRDPRDARTENDPRDWMPPRTRLALIVAFLVLWFAPSAGLFVLVHRVNHAVHGVKQNQYVANIAFDKAAAQTRELRTYEIASCHRGNERTVSENISQRDDYRFFTTTSRLIKAALAAPQVPQQAAHVQRTQRFVAGLEADARDKVWHHLIEGCAFAVDNPGKYRLPPAVAFAAHQPPRGALEVQKGE